MCFRNIHEAIVKTASDPARSRSLTRPSRRGPCTLRPPIAIRLIDLCRRPPIPIRPRDDDDDLPVLRRACYRTSGAPLPICPDWKLRAGIEGTHGSGASTPPPRGHATAILYKNYRSCGSSFESTQVATETKPTPELTCYDACLSRVKEYIHARRSNANGAAKSSLRTHLPLRFVRASV